MQHVVRGVAAAYPVGVAESDVPLAVLALAAALEVVAAVELVQGPGADHPQVPASDEATAGIADVVLRQHVDAAGAVQLAQEHLPDRLSTRVGPGEGHPQPAGTPALGGVRRELGERRTRAPRSVDQAGQVEHLGSRARAARVGPGSSTGRPSTTAVRSSADRRIATRPGRRPQPLLVTTRDPR